jgi:hypothetical protein
MERQLIYSAIRTPDGTILESKHVHDFVTHLDKNGETYMLDGGVQDYIRRSVNIEEAEDISLYSDAPHEQIREVISRGSRGKSGREPLTYIKLKDIDDEYLEALIEYEEANRPNNRYLPFYKQEKIYRDENNK